MPKTLYELCLLLTSPDPGHLSTPPCLRYDCVWIQWCLMYLTDADVHTMFERASTGLRAGGVIVIKENVCGGDKGFVVDNEDSSLTRSNAYMLELFERSNMQVRDHLRGRADPPDPPDPPDPTGAPDPPHGSCTPDLAPTCPHPHLPERLPRTYTHP